MIVAVSLILISLLCVGVRAQEGEEEAREWLAQYNQEVVPIYFANVDASWIYNTNITEHNLNKSVGDQMRICVPMPL